MNSKLLISFCLFLLWTSKIQAQMPIWNEIALEEETNLAFLQTDTIGFIWGLSKEGLFQYDGLKLTKKINRSDASNSFISLEVDQFFNFIIGTSEGQIVQYNPYSHKVFNTQIKWKNAAISYLDCNDIDRECLMLSYGNGVIWTTADYDTLLTIDNILISNEVYSAVLKSNTAILATDQGIQILEKNKKQLTSKTINKSNGLGDVIITNIIENEGIIWASNFDSQIYRIDLSTLTTTIFNLPSKGKINGIKFIGDIELAVYSNAGIYFLENKIWKKKYPYQGRQEILDITLDEEHNLWACNTNNSLSKANLDFQLIPNNIDKAQAILKIDNTFWIGSSEGLFIIDKGKTSKILNKNITCLKLINDDVLVGTFSSGVHILNKEHQILTSIDGWENNPNQSVLYLYPTDDFLYISSLTGVIKVKLSKTDGQYTTSNLQNLNEFLGAGYVYQIMENDGHLYFATDRQGIKILRNDSLQHITHFDNGNTLGSIYSMTKCDDGRVWFASSIGHIGYVEDDMVYYINNERFLQDPYTSLITTSDQKIIMIRNSSIDLYDPKSDHFLYYNDILNTSNQDLYLNSFTQENNTIWLAKNNGILKIGAFDNQKTLPEVIVNEVKVNLIDIGEERSFAESQNNLEFKYSAAWMTDPEKITYKYKLDGLDETWRTTRDQSAIYPMLRPGKYIFKIRTSVDGKFSNEPEKTFQFTIRQSFYKTWWFILLTLLLFGAIFRKWRNERKKVRLQAEALNKKRIEAQLISLQTQLNPHFLFNSFNTLIGLIEENPKKGITFTEQLTDFYRNILEVGKSDLIPLKDEIQLLETYILLIKERFGDQLQIDVDLEDMEPYHIPPLTLQLLIENAVKHNVVSTKQPLHIEIKQIGKSIILKNKISPKYGNSKGTGLGLENIKKRHTLINLRPPHIEKTNTHFIITIYLNYIKV